MASAVRSGDVTDQGGSVIVTGPRTVFIGGKPAALANDITICNNVQPPAPSPFPVGSATVFINNLPALRTSDSAACGARVVVGDLRVNIGG